MTEPELKTAYEWNDDPHTMIKVESWSDFGNSAWRQGMPIEIHTPISWEEFKKIRSGPGAAVTVRWRDGSYLAAAEAEEAAH